MTITRSMPADETSAIGTLCGTGGQWILAAFHTLRRRWLQRRELLAMDDIGLRDLSLTAADAQHEGERPFWSRLRIPARDSPDRLRARR